MFSRGFLDKLSRAGSVVAFTGAGISAESGVPTFRGAGGLWKKYRPEELANLDAFLRNPDLVWEWYRARRQVMSGIMPNAGHYALAGMENHFKRFAVITQNIDNLHRRAGSRTVFELHGNIERNYCIGCHRQYTSEVLPGSEGAPRCPACNGLIRPDVVWFGELLPAKEWDASVSAAEGSDVFLSIGTSAVVYPAASLPMAARRSGAYVAEINIEPTEASDQADEVILGRSGEILPKLLEHIITIQKGTPP